MYAFFLGGVRLPITPSSIDTKINGNNETVELINGGEINIIKSTGLTDIDFEFEIPIRPNPNAVYLSGFQPPQYFLQHLEKLKNAKSETRLIITRSMPNGTIMFETNMMVTIEDYKIEEDADNGGDLVISIDLKQYRPYSTQRLVIKKTTTNPTTNKTTATVAKTTTRSTEGKVTPKSHKVVKGDTLWGIAKKYLGNGARYPELAKLNKIKNPNRIYPGQVIKLG